jgi:hypothetical protein
MSDFAPSLRISNGAPVGRTYWGLPVTTIAKTTANGKSPHQIICGIIDENLAQLDVALSEFARERVLRSNNDGHVQAHCCVQAMETLKDVRQIVDGLATAAGL